ncbi:MAG: hypothetical protein IJ097_05145 [Bacilli bacterium]|nr:hypothetical protein [Bacilli bacterium]
MENKDEKYLDRDHLSMYLEILTRNIYNSFSYLFEESLEETTEKVKNRYLYSGMSVDSINKDMMYLFEEKKRRYIEKKENEEKRKLKEDNRVSELNAMLNDNTSSEKVNTTDALEKPKVLVLDNNTNNSNSQKGIISIFSITLSVLIVTGVILTAMILNLILR